MAKYLSNFSRTVIFIFGCVAVFVGLVVSGEDYVELLIGRNGKDLSWGPNLFRALLLFHGLLFLSVSLFWDKLKTNSSLEPDITTGQVSNYGTRELIVLITITLVAIVLRLINLNSDLWVDEVFTLVDFVRLPMGQIFTSFPNQNQHMLYSVLARLSFDVFGESAWALRIPAVLFGVGSIWALYFFTRSFLGQRTALFSAVLMAVSYHHIWFSQNARGYTGLLFFTLLCTWIWLEALKSNRMYWWIGYVASAVLGMWIHMTMAFVLASHGIVYVILMLNPKLSGDSGSSRSIERSSGIRPIFAWLMTVTLTLQLYALSLPEFLRVALHEESKNSLWTNPVWVVMETLQSLSIGFAGFAVVSVGAAFVAWGWVDIFRRNRRAAVLMVLPPVIGGGFMLSLGHNLFPRFFFFAMGFGILIVIHGATRFPETISGFLGNSPMIVRVSGFASSGLVILMIVASLITVPRNYAMPKQDFSGAKAYVESQRKHGEAIVAVSLAGDMYGNYFAPDWSVAESTDELQRFQQSNSGIWLVYTLSPEIKAFHPKMWEIIEADYKVVKTFPGSLKGGEVFVCRRRGNYVVGKGFN